MLLGVSRFVVAHPGVSLPEGGGGGELIPDGRTKKELVDL